MTDQDSMSIAIRMLRSSFLNTPEDERHEAEFERILSKMDLEVINVLAAMTAIAAFALSQLPEVYADKLFAQPDNVEFMEIVKDLDI